VAKLSDSPGKSMGVEDPDYIAYLRRVFELPR
jgi:nicotinate phosphoribosyltransferase